jgi:hypothetical protein
MTKNQVENAITIPGLNLGTFKLTLEGDSPLICNRFSEKAKQQMLDKMTKKAKQARPAKNPEAEFKGSLYPIKGGYGFPVVAFKSAAVDACSHADGITKVEARGAFHINGEFAKIHGVPTMRQDTVKVGMGSTDLRYRGEFKKWSTTLEIRYNKNVLSAEQIVNLFNIGGFAIGVGEWRPQRDGSYGMFHVR